jgi:Subtilase family
MKGTDMRCHRLALVTVPAVLLSITMPAAARAGAAAGTAASGPGAPPPAPTRTIRLYDGDTVTLSPGGIGWRTDPAGHRRPVAVVDPQGRSGLGDRWGPTDAQVAMQMAARDRGPYARGEVIVVLSHGTTVTGARLPAAPGENGLRAATTSDSRVNSAFRVLRATSLRPALAGSTPAALAGLTTAATTRLGARAIDLSSVYVAHVTAAGPAQAAAVLQATPGVVFAEPDWTVSAMNTGAQPLARSSLPAVSGRAATVVRGAAGKAVTPPPLPHNYGLASSLQSYLNANGVDAAGAYATIRQRFGRLPGQGEIITNVSLGDLTDQAMANGGDQYVQYFGPTTIVENGHRYLDYPALPLIPTYVAGPSGGLDPLGTVEGVDPTLGEPLLDFSVMAPLPHNRQRPGAVGSGATDLLGIAPGAAYRLVEPQQPTIANVAPALMAAAQQTPRPDVITASLGYGFDSYGFPGRYLEDDPVTRTIVAGIVQGDRITVCISANDGTRLYTPAAVGPDGGSAPTDLAAGRIPATSVADDGFSTTPSEVPDSGAIAAGGTTLDDVAAVPPQDGGPLSANPTFAETRISGATNFSSGFGTRVDVSAPSDNIAVIAHQCLHFGQCQPTDAVPVLEGGTSASAPMTAAAVAVALQVARLTGHPLTPSGVRQLLERTGRSVPTPPQIDRTLHVGPQIDVTAAVDALLEDAPGGPPVPVIVRLSVAHREAIGYLGAEFEEATDPSAIDLAGPAPAFLPPTGEGLVGPITFGVDGPGIDGGGLTYALTVGTTSFTSAHPYVRVTARQLFAAAGQPLASADPRSFPVTFHVMRGHRTIASATKPLTFGPDDGTHAMAPAPVVPPVTPEGSAVTVRYHLTGVRNVAAPQLLVSSIGHWSPSTASWFRVAYSVPLSATSGTVTIPASVFAAGGGIYGVGIEQNTPGRVVGAFAPFRIGGTVVARPDAPLLAAAGRAAGHKAVVTRANPRLTVGWDTDGVPGATGAMLEVSAPGPTVYSLYNTFTNANGSGRDHDGVDTGSVAWRPLPGKSGRVTLSALALRLSSSLDYSIRVFATHGGVVIGQASPSSFLEFDDRLAPGGATVNDFSIVPGGRSVVATNSYDAGGALTDSSLRDYDPATGSYGRAFADDPSGQNAYYLYGADPGLGRTVAVRHSWLGTGQDVQIYDSATGRRLADLPVDAATQYSLLGGRVDPVRHRAVVLAQSAADGSDTLLPVGISAGTMGTPLDVDTGSSRRVYTALDVDSSTGKVVVAQAMPFDLCVIRVGRATVADLDTGSVAPAVSTGRCITGVASGQANGAAYLTLGPLFSFPNLLPRGHWQTIDETSLAAGPQQPLGANSPLFPVIDPVHNLAVVGFLATSDYLVNNNAMSAVGVYDLSTGKLVSLSADFNFIASGLNGAGWFPWNERGIQIDPATRTGWTYGPGDQQVQRFRY